MTDTLTRSLATITVAPDLVGDALITLLVASTEIVEDITERLTSDVLTVKARIVVDETFSTPNVALRVAAEHPTGYFDFDAVAVIRFAPDGGGAWVQHGYNEHHIESTDPADVARLAGDILAERIPA